MVASPLRTPPDLQRLLAALDAASMPVPGPELANRCHIAHRTARSLLQVAAQHHLVLCERLRQPEHIGATHVYSLRPAGQRLLEGIGAVSSGPTATEFLPRLNARAWALLLALPTHDRRGLPVTLVARRIGASSRAVQRRLRAFQRHVLAEPDPRILMVRRWRRTVRGDHVASVVLRTDRPGLHP